MSVQDHPRQQEQLGEKAGSSLWQEKGGGMMGAGEAGERSQGTPWVIEH